MALYAIKNLRPLRIKFTEGPESTPDNSIIEKEFTVFVREDQPIDGMAVVDKLIDTGDVAEDGKMFEFIAEPEYTPIPAYVIVDCL